MCPYIHAVHRHIDGKISDKPDSLFVGIVPELSPLYEKEVLQDFPEVRVPPVPLFRFLQSFRLPAAKSRSPLLPGCPAVIFFQSHKKCIILQPISVFPAESFKIRRRSAAEPLCGPAQNRIPLPIENPIVYIIRAALPINIRVLFPSKISLSFQLLQIQEIGVSRIGRKGLIRGISIAGRTDGEKLLKRLSCFLQKINKFIGGLSHAADSVRGRQGRQVHQNSISFHFFSHPLLSV